LQLLTNSTPKRSLGQNFFVNKRLGEKIVSLVCNENPKNVVEIGPGEGFFTEMLSQKTNVVAIEKDDLLAQNLSLSMPSVKIVHADFLDLTNLDSLVPNGAVENTVIFGALPYNISKRIIRKILLESKVKIAYFIIQKEVAEKYTSKEPDKNALSVCSSVFADFKKVFDISPESFRPRPKVTSTLIKAVRKSDIPKINFQKFEDFVHLCFIQPRRTIKNNLKNLFEDGVLPDKYLEKRPQELSTSQFLELFTKCYNANNVEEK